MKINGMSLAKFLRKAEDEGLHQYGHRRSLCRYYMSDSRYHEDDHRLRELSHEEHKALYRLHKRWKRFCNYVEEIAPGWQEVNRIYWADNSVEAVQVSIDGRERKVMVTGPYGDAC